MARWQPLRCWRFRGQAPPIRALPSPAKTGLPRRTAAVAPAVGMAESTKRPRLALAPQLLRHRLRGPQHRKATLRRRQGARPVPLPAKTARLRLMAAAVLAAGMAESTRLPRRPVPQVPQWLRRAPRRQRRIRPHPRALRIRRKCLLPSPVTTARRRHTAAAVPAVDMVGSIRRLNRRRARRRAALRCRLRRRHRFRRQPPLRRRRTPRRRLRAQRRRRRPPAAVLAWCG
ncbi:MAG: hypothetical protein JWN85_3378 [Gammaproteobacteria bacterium]|nr:hypothetical protein [Gammaproteobacteria bacterium]